MLLNLNDLLHEPMRRALGDWIDLDGIDTSSAPACVATASTTLRRVGMLRGL